jgi:parvulin-like peptidyl-prolyl isomerase
VSEAAVDEIPAAEVARFYDEHRDYFTRPGRHRVAVVWVRGEPGRADAEAVARAAEAARRLRAGEPFEDVRSALGDPEVAPVPDDLLPATKLREYLGTAALEIALALAPGEASDPVRTAGGYSVLLLRSREPDRTPPLPEIEPEVRAELRRRAGDGALARYLGELRERADVRIAEPAP